MNLFKLKLLILLSVCAWSQQSELQAEFDEALSRFAKRESPQFSKNLVINRNLKPSTKRSSEKAKKLNDLYELQLEFVSKKVISKRAHPSGFSPVGFTINSTYCPFKQSISCPSSIYRSYDGSCNNIQNPIYGMINMPFKRVLTPDYDDNMNSPRSTGVNGGQLPNVRSVSLEISPPEDTLNKDDPTKQNLKNEYVSNLFTHFGQFITHDMTHLSTTTDSKGHEIDCPCDSTNPVCMPIPVKDIWLGNLCALAENYTEIVTEKCLNSKISSQTCMNFTRSSASFSNVACSPGPREQVNLNSAYIDGAIVYGIDSIKADALRTLTGGLLRTDTGMVRNVSYQKNFYKNMTYNYANGRSTNSLSSLPYLPLDNKLVCRNNNFTYNRDEASFPIISKNTSMPNVPGYCNAAGDDRASENPALLSMHTLFTREHNRVATQLAKLNPGWNDERLYQEARRIVIAQIQHIIFNEYLPVLSGDKSLKPSPTGFYNGYDPKINVTIYNEFATAAFRFGHSLIRDRLNAYVLRYGKSDYQNVWVNSKELLWPHISDMIYSTTRAYDQDRDGLNGFLNGLQYNKAWRFGTFVYELQNAFIGGFQPDNITPIYKDLLAINIQRGRDHGFPGYTQYLKYYFNVEINSFKDLSTVKVKGQPIMSAENATTLNGLYQSVNDIDLYAGGFLENPLPPTLTIGPTFNEIIMQQFKELKNGDRFYYENPQNGFTADQLNSIKKVTMAGLICNNYDVAVMSKYPFLTIKTGRSESIEMTIDKLLNMNNKNSASLNVYNDTQASLPCSSLIGQIDFTKWQSKA